MGSVISKAQLILEGLNQLRATYDVLVKRVQASPGLPTADPTLPLWTVPRARVPPDTTPTNLPEYADIVIIGSGITGASIAYNILAQEAGVKIVVLEAREVCSGATGRNGGHINPPLYHDYGVLRDEYGEHVAKVMIAFRRAHLTEIQRIAIEEGILEQSQCRETEHLDVFTCPKAFAESKANLENWRAAMPVESSSFVCHERAEAIEKFRLSEEVLGCISNAGGAVHPYRFVTSLLSILLIRHPDALRIFTRTPCTSILAPADSTAAGALYAVTTPRGSLRTRHVVHATNGWSSHLLPAFRAKICPARGAMSAQRPGTALHSGAGAGAPGARSYVFYRGVAGYDYLTQLPEGEHELMFGGGWAQACDDGLPELGVADDGAVNHASQSYLAGALPQYFGLANWGHDAVADEEEGAGGSGDADVRWGSGRTKAQWSGILGISVDGLPWVGRLPEKVAGRTAPKPSLGRGLEKGEKIEGAGLATPGEWISAGYSGEGMVHAWMSGKALAHMIVDKEDEIAEWFPDVLRVTEKRWREASIDNLIARFM
ncbi:FAD dependent oxidoreductase [Trametes meyenii]|nr:FAD dependent oxidoreductase [Trametes meyenii]